MNPEIFDVQADTAIHALKTRRRAEIELLGMFAAAPRHAGVILLEFDADLSWFADEDTRAICLALDRASKSPTIQSIEDVGCFARDLLRRLNLWNDADDRPFVTGGAVWGPGPLSALLTRVEFDVEELRHVCRRLLRVIQSLNNLEGNHRGT